MAVRGPSRFRWRRRIHSNMKPGTPLGVYRQINSSGQVTFQSNPILTGSSVSHTLEYCWDHVNALSKTRRRNHRIYDVGGPFAKIKVERPILSTQGRGVYSTRGNPGFSGQARWEYIGGFTNPSSAFDGVSSSQWITGGGSDENFNTLIPSTALPESQAWSRLAPKISKANLFVSLAELGEVPRMLKQTARSFHNIWKDMVREKHNLPWQMQPKRVADEFLNNQFGWVPFVNDIRQMADAVIFSDQYIRDLTAMNNQWMKRGAILEESEKSSHLKRVYSFGCEPGGFEIESLCKQMTVDGNACFGYYDVFARTITRAWAEGSFKFYLPEFDASSMPSYNSAWNTVNRHLDLYGLRLNPSTLYKATPWTWLVDWFTEVGKRIDDVNSVYFDGVVSKYLYVMHHMKREIVSSHYLNFWSGGLNVSWSRYLETKQRKASSSPFAFAPALPDLTARQFSILAALGLSKRFSRFN